MALKYKGPKRISSVERLRSSVNGNPRYAVTFTDDTTANTETDGGIGYSINNSEYRDCDVEVAYTPAGTITDVRPIMTDDEMSEWRALDAKGRDARTSDEQRRWQILDARKAASSRKRD